MDIVFEPDGTAEIVAGGDKDGAAAIVCGCLYCLVNGFRVEGDAVAGGAEIFDVVDAGVETAEPGDQLFGVVGLDALDMTGEEGLPGGGPFVVALPVEPEADAFVVDEGLERGVVDVIEDEDPFVLLQEAVDPVAGRMAAGNAGHQRNLRGDVAPLPVLFRLVEIDHDLVFHAGGPDPAPGLGDVRLFEVQVDVDLVLASDEGVAEFGNMVVFGRCARVADDERLQFREREAGDGPMADRHSVDGAVVIEDEVAVAGGAQVELDIVGAAADGIIDGRYGVLRRVFMVGTMGNDDGRMAGDRQLGESGCGKKYREEEVRSHL